MTSAAEKRLRIENEFPQLPEGWRVERFRFLFRECKERNGVTPVGDMLSVSEYRGVVPREYEHEEHRRTDQELENYRVVRPGHLAVNTMWLNHLGLGISDHLGHVSPAYAVYEPSKRLDGRFVHHLLRSQFYLKIYLRYLYGIRPNSFQIKSDDWKSIPIILPDLPTQKAIAAFLDRETARIDQLIEKKQRIVELLGERMQAELDHSVEMSIQSGAIWTEVRRVAVRVTDGAHISPETEGGTRPFVSTRDLAAGSIDINGALRTTEESYRYLEHTGCRPLRGDVLFSKDGTIGRVGVVETDEDFVVASSLVIISPNADMVTPQYLALALQSRRVQEEAQLSSRGAALRRISVQNVGRLGLLLPGRALQDAIAYRLDALRHQTTRAADAAASSLELLKEYRSALITAAVTGQIDVETWSRRGGGDRRLDAIQEEMAR